MTTELNLPPIDLQAYERALESVAGLPQPEQHIFQDVLKRLTKCEASILALRKAQRQSQAAYQETFQRVVSLGMDCQQHLGELFEIPSNTDSSDLDKPH